jgi:DnaK suppressor protein
MNTRQLTFFRKQLEDEIARLSLKGKAAGIRLTDDAGPGSDVVDLAALEGQISLAFRIRDRERLLGRKISHALARIAEGTFGICQGCGEDIPIARLKARPVTEYCLDCKTRREARERVLESGRTGMIEAE